MLIPKQIDLEMTSRCQLRCVGCPANDNKLVGDMDFDLFKSIIDRVNFDTTVIPWLNGEPLLYPRYYAVIKYITDRNLRCYITTNGMIWNEELFQLITDDTSCYQILFSLDGLPVPGSRSIEKARPGTDRGKVLDTIDRFRKLKLAKNSKVDMAIKIIHRGQDYEEIENCVYYWLQQPGISYVCVGKMLNEESTRGMRMYPCRYSQNNFMVIKWDGRLVRCAYNTIACNTDKYIFGYIDKTTPLLEVYNNEAYTRFREGQLIGEFPYPCDICGFAYCGDGFDGTVRFRDTKKKDLGAIYYLSDYYNTFYSLEHKRKPREYYNTPFDRCVDYV